MTKQEERAAGIIGWQPQKFVHFLWHYSTRTRAWLQAVFQEIQSLQE